MSTRKKGDGISRREFISAAAAGAGFVALPTMIAGCCGPLPQPPATPVAAPPPPAPVKEVTSPITYFTGFGIDEQVVAATVNEAMSRGGTFSELFFQHQIRNYVGLQDGEVNRVYSVVDLGCGVRVVKGDQTGYAFTQDLSPQALADAAKTAAVVANETAAAPVESFQRGEVPSYYKAEIPWTEVGLDKKIPLLSLSNEHAFKTDNRVKKVEMFLIDTTSNIMIARSDGQILEDYQPSTRIWMTCMAEDKGRRETNYEILGRRAGLELYTEADLRKRAESLVKRTTVLFDAVPAPTGEMPVVLGPGVPGILLHEAMGHGFEADFNRKGISIYNGQIGKRIAPEFVTIVDDGTNPDEYGSINIDDEGSPTARTVLVENGILKSYMHDRISANHFKVAPTGNGRREDFRFPPVPRMRNTIMLNGPHDPKEIISSVKQGIYAEHFANGQVDIGAGDFAFYLQNGYLIEDGKITRPIKDANLIGSGPKVLEQLEMVGNDMAMGEGGGTCGKDRQGVPVGFALPTTKCNAISVGGKKS